MKSLFQKLLVVSAIITLSACGGGGSNSTGPTVGTGNQVAISVSASPASIPANTEELPVQLGSPFISELTVTVTNNGQAITNGTVVSATISPVNVALLSTPDDGSTADVNEFTQMFSSTTQPTSGGKATFFVHSQQIVGNATITVSVNDPFNGGAITQTINVSVTEGPDPLEHLTIEAVRTTLPANISNVPVFLGSPYMTEATITLRDANGDLVSGEDLVQVSINPVTIAAFSTLDDPSTADVNELTVLLGSGPVDVEAGKATIFLHSFDSPGLATVTLSANDPVTGAAYEASLDLTVVESASNGLPAQIDVTLPAVAQYVQGSGGLDARQFEINLTDGASEPVPDPANGSYNNVQLSIINDGSSSGESISGTNSQGSAVSGTTISVSTTNGVLSAVMRSGTEPGVKTVQVTADRADNNVDNGLQDPISDLVDFVISDGQLFSLEITSPDIESIVANRVISSDGVTEGLDGTYSMTVSALATDRLGNPVLPTEIAFNIIDFPITGYPLSGSGQFLLRGSDGDPQEGGQGFTSPGGAFMTAGGGAGPGDAVMVFGENVEGNRDHESMRIVQSVNSQTSLTVTNNFNLNDDTGVSVNSGPILPYVIGRSSNVNVGSPVITNAIGVATTTINFPVTVLGQITTISAQGNGGIGSNGVVKTVADVEQIVMPGIAPASFSVSTTEIGPNIPVDVQLCVVDANNTPVPAIFVRFDIINQQGSLITVDGKSPSGFLNQATDANGCSIATIVTDAITPDLPDETLPRILFSVGSLVQTVTVQAPNPAELFAVPNAFIGGSRTETVTLTLLDAVGGPQNGVQVDFLECREEGNINSNISPLGNLVAAPGITDVNGQTTATIQVSGLSACDVADIKSVFCFFAGPAGEPTSVVSFVGFDLNLFSPNVCPSDTNAPVFYNLAVGVLGNSTNNGQPPGDPLFESRIGDGEVTTVPATFLCSAGLTCDADFDDGSIVTISAVPNDPDLTTGPGGSNGPLTADDVTVQFSGACVGGGTGTQTVAVTMSNDKSCVVEFIAPDNAAIPF